MDESADGLVISGGPIAELAVRTDPASSVHRLLTARSRGEPPSFLPKDQPWSELGTGQVTALTLDPADPRRPLKSALVGRPRSSLTVWRSPSGALRLDSAHQVRDIAAERLFSISAVQGKGTYQISTFEPPAAEGEGWLVGYRLALGDAQLTPVGQPPEAHAPGRYVGRIAGQSVHARLAVRAAGVLYLIDADGRIAASLPLTSARLAFTERLLLAGPQVEITGEISEVIARWLLRGASEGRDVVELVSDGARPVHAAVSEGALWVDGIRLASLDEIDLSMVRTLQEGGLARLTIGEVSVCAPSGTIAHIREQLLASSGRSSLAKASWSDLYASWREIRTERWLWLVYGPLFSLERKLEEFALLDLPARDLASVLLVGEHGRALQSRLTALPASLPYLLIEEESEWMEVFSASPRDGRGEAALAALRSRINDGFRAHLQQIVALFAPGLDELSCILERLESFTREEMPWGWGAASLSANLDLEGRSGEAVLKLRLERDPRAVAFLSHIGARSRAACELLIDIAAVVARETQEHLELLWAASVERDRVFGKPLSEPEREQLRMAIVDRILAARALRAAPFEGGDRPRGERYDRMKLLLAGRPRALAAKLSGR